MNSQKDSTKYDVNIQEAFHNWNRKIETQFIWQILLLVWL